jgi:hypothetical protein
MAVDRQDLLRHYRESRVKMLAALDGLTEEQGWIARWRGEKGL